MIAASVIGLLAAQASGAAASTAEAPEPQSPRASESTASPRAASVLLDRISEMQARAKPIICKVFGEYCAEALRVSWCESHWYVWARNGQYLGLFQMGYWERLRYGHGSGAWDQSRAAWRYFTASGRDWSPWSCRWAA